MAFKDYKDVAKKYGIGQSNDWMSLQEGDNWIRIVTPFEPFRNHFDERTNRGTVCVGSDNDCSACNAGIQASVKCLGWVIDRNDEKIKLLRMPYSAYKAIGELQLTKDYEFDDLPPYDVNLKKIITKTAGGEKTSYQVVAARKNTDLTEEELFEIDKKCKNPVDILEKMKEKEGGSKKTAYQTDDGQEPYVTPDNF